MSSEMKRYKNRPIIEKPPRRPTGPARGRAGMTLIERFESYIEKTESCWNWTGCLLHTSIGYGRIWVNGKVLLAHRASFILRGIEIPPGMEVDHLCHNPRCVRPDHLEIVTPSVNINRRSPPSEWHKRPA